VGGVNFELGKAVFAAPVALDAELQVAYDAYLAEEPELAPMSSELLPRIRGEVDTAVAALGDLSRGGRFVVCQPSVPGLDGAPEMPLLICTPASAPASRPALYFMHGGGFFCNDHRIGLDQVLETAERFGATLVSIGYRLAPEHPYPAQINDAHAGLLWVADQADELGIDPGRIVVTGSSAGGGLSAALALTVRDKGGPRLLGQLLMCPMLDDRNDSASAMQMDEVEFWDRSHNLFGWRSLLGDVQGGADVPQYAAPARATDLTGCRPRSSASAPPSVCATKPSPTPPGSGRPAARPNCTCGPAESMRSTGKSPRRGSARPPSRRATTGWSAYWPPIHHPRSAVHRYDYLS
jgi:acetyl esterase/lipase